MSKIIGTGMYVPGTIVSNDDISDNDEWIVKNIGIKERRIATPHQTTSSLGLIAGLHAIESSGLNSSSIDMVIVATSTPDKIAPSTACLITSMLALKCPAFDINAVCSGFLFAMSIAEQYLRVSPQKKILVIGADTFSKITDWNDRNCVFFGDGAGAVVVTGGYNLQSVFIGTDNSEQGFTCENGSEFKMIGSKVRDTALRIVPLAIDHVLSDADLSIDDIDYLVPHQPSKKILTELATAIGLPQEKVLMNMDKYANTSAATIPILLYESWDKFKKGDRLLFAAIGSGWTYGAAIYEV
jgi:3-oxoacyl-[acyl-carrier-protein] synthase III